VIGAERSWLAGGRGQRAGDFSSDLRKRGFLP